MTKAAVYNIKGEKTKDIDLNEAVFAVPTKEEVVHSVYTALTANARQPWANAKDRSEVSGGGRKPWKQKGTGRARHGSNRSPIWSGGGVTFGPLSIRNYKQKINKKVSAKAVKMCLSDKVKNDKFVIAESFEFGPKTKDVALFTGATLKEKRKTLFVAHEKNDVLLASAKNLSDVDIVRAQDVNVVDLLHHTYVVAELSALEILEKRLAK